MLDAITTNALLHSLRLLFLVNCLVLLLPAAHAQLTGRIADKPIAIGYARDIGPAQVMDYAKKLTERLDIGKSMREELTPERMQEQGERSFPKIEHPLYGVAWYMVTGPIPTFETVTFQQVIDEADARRLVNGRKQQWGDNGSIEDHGNGCFTVTHRRGTTFELPAGTDEKKFTSKIKAPLRNVYQLDFKIIEKDGKKHVETSRVMSQLFRYHDNMLYEGAFDELFTMELPLAVAITSGVDGAADLGFDAYLDRIPQGIRMLGWNMLTAAVGSQLQQRDDEPETGYAMRRSSGDLGLALTKAVLFDFDHSDGWLRFASEDEPSIRAELRIRPRKNSQLSQQLLEAGGVSRFAPILNDGAAVTVHMCVRLPEEAPAALVATGTWLHEAIGREFNNDAAMVTATNALSETLVDIAEHGNLELLLKGGWTKESGGVFYGGLQVSDNSQLLSSIHRFLTNTLSAAPANINEIIALTEIDGVQMIRIQIPADEIERFQYSSGMTISHIWLAHQNSSLWFAAGAENSKEILRQSMARCTEGSVSARTPLVSIRIDMERWLSWPKDDPAGIAQLPHYLDENAWWFPPNPMRAMMFSRSGGNSEKPTPIMQRVFDLGGSQQFWLTVEADDSGILVQTSLGEALANYMLARGIESQESMMAVLGLQLEEEVKAQKEAQKAVPIPEPPAE